MSGVSKMMNNVALKFAVSAVAIGTTMVACKPAADASRPRRSEWAVYSPRSATCRHGTPPAA